MRNRILLATLALGCGGGRSPTSDGGQPNDGRTPVVELPVTINRSLDVLFVIDDSPSTGEIQKNLTDNFPNFVNVLNLVPGGLPDIHLGVISTDMGTRTSNGIATGIGTVGQGGCNGTGKSGNLTLNGAQVTGSFISDIKLTDGSRQKNYTGDLSSTFSTMARLGSTGCGFEQPLAAMKAALGGNATNAGFLRPDALLAVVFLTDEDDCSVKDTALFSNDGSPQGPLLSFRCTRFGVTCTTGGNTPDEMNEIGTKDGCGPNNGASALLDDVTSFHDFLVGLKTNPRNVMVGAIMGTPEPVIVESRTNGGGPASPALAHSCSFATTTGPDAFADPAVRMKSFLDKFGDRATSDTVCQPDLSGGLSNIAQLITLGIGSPCVTKPLADADPATAGFQPDCIVEDVIGASTTPIAECPDGGGTCWSLVTDAAECPVGDHLKLQVTRAVAPPPETVTHMRCVLEP